MIFLVIRSGISQKNRLRLLKKPLPRFLKDFIFEDFLLVFLMKLFSCFRKIHMELLHYFQNSRNFQEKSQKKLPDGSDSQIRTKNLRFLKQALQAFLLGFFLQFLQWFYSPILQLFPSGIRQVVSPGFTLVDSSKIPPIVSVIPSIIPKGVSPKMFEFSLGF